MWKLRLAIDIALVAVWLFVLSLLHVVKHCVRWWERPTGEPWSRYSWWVWEPQLGTQNPSGQPFCMSPFCAPSSHLCPLTFAQSLFITSMSFESKEGFGGHWEKCRLMLVQPNSKHIFSILGHLRPCWLFSGAYVHEEIHVTGTSSPLPAYIYFPYRHLFFCLWISWYTYFFAF